MTTVAAVVVAGGEVLNSHEVVEDVEDEAVIFSSWMAETDVDFGTTELVRIIETATVFCCCDLTSFLSEEEDGNGERRSGSTISVSVRWRCC